MFQVRGSAHFFPRNVCGPPRFFLPQYPKIPLFRPHRSPFVRGPLFLFGAAYSYIVHLFALFGQAATIRHLGAKSISRPDHIAFSLTNKKQPPEPYFRRLFSLLFLYRRSCSSGREKCRRLRATYTPSWSLEDVTKSAAACTPGTALPMATPRPARRSMPTSTSPSPQATA